MARPTKNNPTGAQKSPKLTKETISKLEQAFALDCTVLEACFYANISAETYYRWIKGDKKLYDNLKRLKTKPVLKARKTVNDALGEDPKIALDYLKQKNAIKKLSND